MLLIAALRAPDVCDALPNAQRRASVLPRLHDQRRWGPIQATTRRAPVVAAELIADNVAQRAAMPSRRERPLALFWVSALIASLAQRSAIRRPPRGLALHAVVGHGNCIHPPVHRQSNDVE